jgi:hypothetical protein
MSNDREIKASDTYLDRVKKLIPAEVSAGFLAINSLIPLKSEFNLFVLGFFVALLVICILYMYRLEMVTNLFQIIFVSIVAYPIWALNISIARIEWMQDREFLAGCLLVIVTLLIPLLVKPQATAVPTVP